MSGPYTARAAPPHRRTAALARSRRAARTEDPATNAIEANRAALPQIPNFRDLGGHPAAGGQRVRTGLVYRSTVLAGLPPPAEAQLWGLGIRTVYDLRGAEERTRLPEAGSLPADVEYVLVDVIGAAASESPMWLLARLDTPEVVREAIGDGRAETLFRAKFRRFVTAESARAAYAALFSGLAQPSRLPAVFHCSTGKDRTGWAAAALLALLGVPDDVVERDFLASTDAVRPMMAPLVAQYVAAGGRAEDLDPLVGVMPSYLESALDEMRRVHGTVERYFTDGLGLDEQVQARLRSILLESA